MTVPTGPAEIVQDGYESFKALGISTFNKALDFVEALPTITVPAVDFNINFPALGGLGGAFTKPVVPITPDVAFHEPTAPADADVVLPSLPSQDVAPVFIDTPLDISLPTRPDALTAIAPSDAPVITDRTVPTAPTITLPDVPNLLTIDLPSPVLPVFPVFSAVEPVIDFSPPAANFTFTEPGYSSAALTLVQARVEAMLAGGTGLPAVVEQQLFERARAREDATAQAAVQVAAEEWSARGFALPGGELAARITNVRERNQDAANTLSRDIFINAKQIEVENLRFSVTSGIALETMLSGLYNTMQQRAFDVKRYMLESAIAIYNAQASLYNSRLQLFTAKASVFRDKIQAELGKLEVFKAQIEAAKTRGEINVQNIQIYAERVRALISTIEIYKAQVDGVRAQTDVDRARAEVFRSRVDAFGAQVSAKRAEFESYSAAVQGEVAKTGIFQSQVSAFGERVRAFGAKIEAGLALPKFQMEQQRLKIDKMQAQVSRYNAQVDGEARRIAAAVDIFRGKADMYGAELNAEQARVVADSRQFQLNLESGRAQTSLALEQVKTNIQQVQTATQIMLEAVKSAGQVSAQLASGAISAVNLSAGISGSSSDSTSTSYSLTGDSPSPPAA